MIAFIRKRALIAVDKTLKAPGGAGSWRDWSTWSMTVKVLFAVKLRLAEMAAAVALIMTDIFLVALRVEK